MPNSSDEPTNPSAKPSEGYWLAIETADRYGSIAVAQVSGSQLKLLGSQDLPHTVRSAQSLAPAIQGLLTEHGLTGSSISTVAVAVGPGSFTGLRVGVATAKAFAYATGAGVIGVNTLDALASGQTSGARLWTALDAHRGELFASLRTGSAPPDATPPQRILREDFIPGLQTGDHVVGPVVDSLDLENAEGVSSDTRDPNAQGVLQVAQEKWQAGEWDDVYQLVPQYYRASAAEENLAS